MLKDDIIKYNKEGKPNGEIEFLTGATRNYIKEVISEAGLKSNTLKLRAIEMRRKGMQTKEIATVLGCAENTLKGYFTKEGLTDKIDKKATEERYNRMYNMYVNEGKSIEEIAIEFGFAASSVKSRLSNLGALRVKDRRFVKNKNSEKKEKSKEEIIVEQSPIIEEKKSIIKKEEFPVNDDKPYEVIDDDIVIYNGRMYRIMDKYELRYCLSKDLKIKGKRKGRRKKKV